MTLLIILYFGGLGWVGGPQHGQDVVSTFTLYFMKSDIYFRMRNEFEGGKKDLQTIVHMRVGILWTTGSLSGLALVFNYLYKCFSRRRSHV